MGFLDRVSAAAKVQPLARVGVVTDVSLSESTCTVLVNDGEVPAYLNDQVIDQVAVGAVVTLRAIGDTYEVASTRTGTSGGNGPTYGPDLLPNSDFEYGPGGFWSGPSAWTIEWDYTLGEPLPFSWDTNPSEAASGSGSVKVDLVAGSWSHAMNVVPENPFRVDSGKTYQPAVWVKASDNTQSLSVKLRTYTADTSANCWAFGTGVSITDHATVVDPGAAYQLLLGTLTVPVGHLYARIVLRTTAPTGAVVVAHWDKASFRQRITS